MYILWYLLLSGLAGFLAGKLMRGRGYGVFADILLGIVGGFVVQWLSVHVLHLYFRYHMFITAFIGALLLVWIARAFRR